MTFHPSVPDDYGQLGFSKQGHPPAEVLQHVGRAADSCGSPRSNIWSLWRWFSQSGVSTRLVAGGCSSALDTTRELLDQHGRRVVRFAEIANQLSHRRGHWFEPSIAHQHRCRSEPIYGKITAKPGQNRAIEFRWVDLGVTTRSGFTSNRLSRTPTTAPGRACPHGNGRGSTARPSPAGRPCRGGSSNVVGRPCDCSAVRTWTGQEPKLFVWAFIGTADSTPARLPVESCTSCAALVPADRFDDHGAWHAQSALDRGPTHSAASAGADQEHDVAPTQGGTS